MANYPPLSCLNDDFSGRGGQMRNRAGGNQNIQTSSILQRLPVKFIAKEHEDGSYP
ncbi:unnamed protein product [Dovyalis caffra]|uniref:Uncharacterized protein n=1 Tax=Dovyalis caffra TaxID=77055 RepID=A0AAV1RIA3_9ROSI|nr:unnamed protein product [Dovyalis caffra]